MRGSSESSKPLTVGRITDLGRRPEPVPVRMKAGPGGMETVFSDGSTKLGAHGLIETITCSHCIKPPCRVDCPQFERHGCVRGEEEDVSEVMMKPADVPEVYREKPEGPPEGAEYPFDNPQVDLKDTNPKDAVGVRKWRQYTTIPTTVLWELGVAMLEGARKYGRHNYRVAGVRGSVYIDAAKGHIDCWWEGEDIDEDSGLSHITKAVASLTVLRDAMIQEKFLDDRPPKTHRLAEVKANLQAIVERMFERIPEAKDAYVEGDQHVIRD